MAILSQDQDGRLGGCETHLPGTLENISTGRAILTEN